MNQPDQYWELDNLPNRLTIFRIALVPVVVIFLFLSDPDIHVFEKHKLLLGWLAGIIFIIASITDYFDGLLARQRGLITAFGSFLDPIADKFLVVSGLIMLSALGRVHSLVVIILVLREMYMTSLRLFAAHQDIKVPVNDMGKWKTACQMTAMPMLMINDTVLGIPLSIVGLILIYLASILSLISATHYSLTLVKRLKEARKEKKKLKSD